MKRIFLLFLMLFAIVAFSQDCTDKDNKKWKHAKLIMPDGMCYYFYNNFYFVCSIDSWNKIINNVRTATTWNIKSLTMDGETFVSTVDSVKCVSRYINNTLELVFISRYEYSDSEILFTVIEKIGDLKNDK